MDANDRKEAQVDDIAPPLACAIEMQHALLNGEPARAGVTRYLAEADGDFPRQMRRALFVWDQGGDWMVEAAKMSSPYRRAVCDSLMRGLAGHSIQSRLEELRKEIELSCELELQKHVESLPLRALLPLLLLEFPAFLLLLFGPLLARLIREMSR